TVTGAGGLITTVPVSYVGNTSAGTASATASYAGDANHNGSSGGTVTFTIAKAAVTATAGSATAIYDGATHSPSACVVSGAGFTGDVVCANSPASVGPAVGTTVIVPVASSASGALANFDVTLISGSFTINSSSGD